MPGRTRGQDCALLSVLSELLITHVVLTTKRHPEPNPPAPTAFTSAGARARRLLGADHLESNGQQNHNHNDDDSHAATTTACCSTHESYYECEVAGG